jgi:hypothetical protein
VLERLLGRGHDSFLGGYTRGTGVAGILHGREGDAPTGELLAEPRLGGDLLAVSVEVHHDRAGPLRQSPEHRRSTGNLEDLALADEGSRLSRSGEQQGPLQEEQERAEAEIGQAQNGRDRQHPAPQHPPPHQRKGMSARRSGG